MKRRPPSARACSLRARRLAKGGGPRAGKALSACAATPKRSKTVARKVRATKSVCRKRGLALQSGRVGRSSKSAVAACPSKKRSLRANPGAALSARELAALETFARRHGRGWKSALSAQWSTASTGVAELQALRNRLGPRWLATFRLPRANPSPRASRMKRPRFTALDYREIARAAAELRDLQMIDEYDGPETVMLSTGYADVYPEGDHEASVTIHGVNWPISEEKLHPERFRVR